MSNSDFEYSKLTVNKESYQPGENVAVSFTVKYTSDVAGKEVAQLYVKDVESSHTRPLKELKSFTKVDAQPKESKEVTLVVSKSDFSYWNPETKE